MNSFIAKPEDPIIVPSLSFINEIDPMNLLQYHIDHPPTSAITDQAVHFSVSWYEQRARRALGFCLPIGSKYNTQTRAFTYLQQFAIMCSEPTPEFATQFDHVFVLRAFSRHECVEEYLKLWRAVLNRQTYTYTPYETMEVWIKGVRKPFDDGSRLQKLI